MQTSLGHKSAQHTSEMLAHVEADTERFKARISRQLHDGLGGVLVAAIMDAAWAEQHLSSSADVKERLTRIQRSLATAIDLTRKIIDNLRPTLLDTVGLFAALQWHHKHLCENSKISWTKEFPPKEPAFAPTASIALYRIIQEALATITRQKTATSAHLSLQIAEGQLSIDVRHDGEVLSAETRAESDAVSFWLIDHRIRALGGEVSVTHPEAGGMKLYADVPLAKVLSSA